MSDKLPGPSYSDPIWHRDKWRIYYDPPPIPTRAFDFRGTHDDYDGPGDNRHVAGASVDDVKYEIDLLYCEDCRMIERDCVCDALVIADERIAR